MLIYSFRVNELKSGRQMVRLVVFGENTLNFSIIFLPKLKPFFVSYFNIIVAS